MMKILFRTETNQISNNIGLLSFLHQIGSATLMNLATASTFADWYSDYIGDKKYVLGHHSVCFIILETNIKYLRCSH